MTYQELLAAVGQTSTAFAATLTGLPEAEALQRLRSVLKAPSATTDQIGQALGGLNVGRLLDNAAASVPPTNPASADPEPPVNTPPDPSAALQAKVASVAPALGAMLDGALRTTALQALGRVVAGDSEADEKTIVAQLSGDGWEGKVQEAQAAALKQISGDASSLQESRLAYQDLDRSRASLAEAQKRDDQDRLSARERQKAARDWWINPALAVIITVGFFSVLGYILKYPQTRDNQVANTMLGVLGTTWVAVVSFYFGSSTGSKEKTKILSRQLERQSDSAASLAAAR